MTSESQTKWGKIYTFSEWEELRRKESQPQQKAEKKCNVCHGSGYDRKAKLCWKCL